MSEVLTQLQPTNQHTPPVLQPMRFSGYPPPPHYLSTLPSLSHAYPMPSLRLCCGNPAITLVLPDQEILMSAIATAITQFFTAITVLFSAFEKICRTADNIATVGVNASGAYMDQSNMDRIASASKNSADLRKQLAADALVAPTTVVPALTTPLPTIPTSTTTAP